MSPNLRGPGNEKLRFLVGGAAAATAAAGRLVADFNRKAAAPGIRERSKDGVATRGHSSAVPGKKFGVK